jgi:hypothetical protein
MAATSGPESSLAFARSSPSRVAFTPARWARALVELIAFSSASIRAASALVRAVNATSLSWSSFASKRSFWFWSAPRRLSRAFARRSTSSSALAVLRFHSAANMPSSTEAFASDALACMNADTSAPMLALLSLLAFGMVASAPSTAGCWPPAAGASGPAAATDTAPRTATSARATGRVGLISSWKDCHHLKGTRSFRTVHVGFGRTTVPFRSVQPVVCVRFWFAALRAGCRRSRTARPAQEGARTRR